MSEPTLLAKTIRVFIILGAAIVMAPPTANASRFCEWFTGTTQPTAAPAPAPAWNAGYAPYVVSDIPVASHTTNYAPAASYSTNYTPAASYTTGYAPMPTGSGWASYSSGYSAGPSSYVPYTSSSRPVRYTANYMSNGAAACATCPQSGTYVTLQPTAPPQRQSRFWPWSNNPAMYQPTTVQEDGPFRRWWRQLTDRQPRTTRRAYYNPYYSMYVPAYSAPVRSSCSSGGCPTPAYTAGYTPAQRTTVAYVPRTCYRTTKVRVPVTIFRPVTTCDRATGYPVTVMKPCTTWTWRVRRVPYTTYQMMTAPCGTTCPTGVPAAVPAGGCSSCQQQSPVTPNIAPLGTPTPAGSPNEPGTTTPPRLDSPPAGGTPKAAPPASTPTPGTRTIYETQKRMKPVPKESSSSRLLVRPIPDPHTPKKTDRKPSVPGRAPPLVEPSQNTASRDAAPFIPKVCFKESPRTLATTVSYSRVRPASAARSVEPRRLPPAGRPSNNHLWQAAE